MQCGILCTPTAPIREHNPSTIQWFRIQVLTDLLIPLYLPSTLMCSLQEVVGHVHTVMHVCHVRCRQSLHHPCLAYGCQRKSCRCHKCRYRVVRQYLEWISHNHVCRFLQDFGQARLLISLLWPRRWWVAIRVPSPMIRGSTIETGPRGKSIPSSTWEGTTPSVSTTESLSSALSSPHWSLIHLLLFYLLLLCFTMQLCKLQFNQTRCQSISLLLVFVWFFRINRAVMYQMPLKPRLRADQNMWICPQNRLHLVWEPIQHRRPKHHLGLRKVGWMFACGFNPQLHRLSIMLLRSHILSVIKYCRSHIHWRWKGCPQFSKHDI
ncbi:uncharacterized protein LOC133510265 [Syngnathoides biaculeatus]|uniref:uncharacterized protein LOC133510265 n=1 Tax=Syngnathoides biaculeatus TaxID=300417 RepID=UPI002ADE7D05|nr:uncharacterized protein LOC133510265 [Syngnathoides biaculeatus]XP_061694071.1 uncharacterized protein LOC133510265 [Syngnathoides biaculeatus]XP_061694072.1 uncharacterized protein LOC133510265 [Syngnathoides biaculeatus]